jgi:YVTN family beta-propeller protein
MRGLIFRTLLACLALAGLLLPAHEVYAQTPSPALLILNKEDNALVIVNPANLKVVGSIPVGNAPHEVAVSGDGKIAVVANYGDQQAGNSLSVIDLKSQKELQRVDLGELHRPHGLEFYDGKFYFTCEANKLIARYDPATNSVDWKFETGQETTHMVALASDGNRIFTANIRANTISLIERPSANADWKQTVIPVGKGPEGMDISPDGKQLWVGNSADGNVSIIDIASKKVVETVPVQTKHSNRLKFTRDGKLALISDPEANEVLVLDVASRKIAKKIPVGNSPEGILVAPDGTRAFLAVTGDNKVLVLDLKTLSITGQISPGKGPDGMAWAK